MLGSVVGKSENQKRRRVDEAVEPVPSQTAGGGRMGEDVLTSCLARHGEAAGLDGACSVGGHHLVCCCCCCRSGGNWKALHSTDVHNASETTL